jgi:predicted dehydrogenase
MNRREFLHTTVFGLAAAALAPAQEYDRDKRRRVGLIGCGWYGKSDLFRLVRVSPVEIVSLCDVDSQMLSNAADMSAARQRSKKRPRTYSDYRKMLAEKDLDLVLVAPPDHWHALIMIETAKSGVDIWVQKPISHDVLEDKAMLAAARRNNRVVQVGLQRRSTPHLVEAKERFINEGMIAH